MSSPVLFTIHTSDCQPIKPNSNDKLYKYADDKALLGLIKADNHSAYLKEIHRLVSWCDENFLQLNTKKTKVLIVDLRKNRSEPAPLVIKGAEVERVSSFKYLGVTLSDSIDSSENTTTVYKKCQSKMYFVRKLQNFNVSKKLVNLFYEATFQ